MARLTNRGMGPSSGPERMFDYPPDKPSLFQPRDYGSSGSESAEPFSPHDTPARIPAPNMKVKPGSSSPQLWKRPQTEAHQLPMFMSAREIQTQYQPLEGDRQSAYDWREGEPTGRAFTTEGQANAPIKSADRRWLERRGLESGHTHYRTEHDETDAQVWDRKLNEAMLPHYEYREVHEGFGATGSAKTPGYETLMEHSSAPWGPRSSAGTGTWESHQQKVDEWVGQRQDEARMQRHEADQWSLHERLHAAMQPGGEGYTSVVHLGTGGPHGQSDKPMVFGAHHRIASMADIDPDRLLPVLHHRQFSEARSTTAKQNPAWRYS